VVIIGVFVHEDGKIMLTYVTNICKNGLAVNPCACIGFEDFNGNIFMARHLHALTLDQNHRKSYNPVLSIFLNKSYIPIELLIIILQSRWLED
jgi:hypothetical protein